MIFLFILIIHIAMNKTKKPSGVRYCAAADCVNAQGKCSLSFFRFPKDEARCGQWIQNSNRHDLQGKTPLQLYSYYYLCSSHFADSQFLNVARKRLVYNAVPTIFHRDTKCRRSTRSTTVMSRQVTDKINDAGNVTIANKIPEMMTVTPYEVKDGNGNVKGSTTIANENEVTEITFEYEVLITDPDVPAEQGADIVSRSTNFGATFNPLEDSSSDDEGSELPSGEPESPGRGFISDDVDDSTHSPQSQHSEDNKSEFEDLIIPVAPNPLLIPSASDDSDNNIVNELSDSSHSSCPDDALERDLATVTVVHEPTYNPSHNNETVTIIEVSSTTPNRVRRGPRAKNRTVDYSVVKSLKVKLRNAFCDLNRSRQQYKLLKDLFKQDRSMDNLIDMGRDNVSERQLQFMEMQLRMAKVCEKERKWTREDKKMALCFYRLGPKSYKLLSEIIVLPRLRTVRKWNAKFQAEVT